MAYRRHLRMTMHVGLGVSHGGTAPANARLARDLLHHSGEHLTNSGWPGGMSTWLCAPAPVVRVNGPLDPVKAGMYEPEPVAAFEAIRA